MGIRLSISKINVAKAALKYVKNGMCIGLGSGSTTKEFIHLLGEKIRKNKLEISCVPTSYDSRMLAIREGLFVTETDAVKQIDLAVDGADKVIKTALLKGGGGALTREKIIDYQARKFIVIVDESKVMRATNTLEGEVNLEVLPFAAPFILKQLKEYHPRVRMAKAKLGPVISDNGCFIIDMQMKLKDPKKTEEWLKSIPGVIENGIFTKFDKILVGQPDGVYEL